MNHLHRLILTLLAVGLLLGCRLFTPTPAPPTRSPLPATQAPPTLAPSSTPPPTATVTQSVTLAPTTAPLPEDTLTPSTPYKTLSQSGPWLLISSSTGLWAANDDGSALTRLTDSQVVSPRDLRQIVSPTGRRVAFVTADPDRLHHLTLNLLSLPDGKLTTVTPLTNPRTEPGPDLSIRDEKVEAVIAITDHDPVAWSPDGATLAFIGVQDGPSADLYTYALATGKITRLSDGLSQAYDPTWSPDGRSILHFGVRTFGTGAGYDMAGVWAARADGSGMLTMVNGGGSGQEFAGWVDDHRFLINAWNPACGKNDLRLQDVNTAKSIMLEKGCFAGAAASPATGLILLGGSGDSPVKGLVSIDPATLARKPLSSGDVSALQYLPDGSDFLVSGTDGAQIISNTGLPMARSPKVNCTYKLDLASYGALYAWTCSSGPDYGVWINGMEVPDRHVFAQSASAPTWSPKNTLFFFSSGMLYRALFPGFQPKKVGPVEGDIYGTVWAVP